MAKDPLHPNGRCTYCGEGECAWCRQTRRAEEKLAEWCRREEPRLTKKQRKALAKLPRKRAHRIEVDRCQDCPFARKALRPFVKSWGTDVTALHAAGQLVAIRCKHPSAGWARFVEIDAKEPPAWCPLRNAVTMIAGPSSLGGGS